MPFMAIEKEFISLKVHNQNESMLVGVLNMDEAMVSIANVEQETQPMLNVEMTASQKYIKYKITKYTKQLGKKTVDRIIRKAFDLWQKPSKLIFKQVRSGYVDIHTGVAASSP